MAGGNTSSLQDAQSRHCKFLSYMFYQAVRDHKPVWMLEDMRTMENFYWEENANLRTYSPSEALLYAVVHNHLPYAQYLLSHFPEEALQVPGEHFCYCPSSAPHLAMAVTYDRRDILGLIISIAHKLPSLNSYINRTGCFHLEDGKTPLHLACELLRSETVLTLLGNGASPRIEDSKGLTPLDVILEQMWDSKVNVASKKLCLDYLLLFMPSPRFKMQKVLQEHPEHWAVLLGEDKFNSLVGNTPASLYLQAMQTILQILPPSHFPKSIQELPIPQALKPLPCLGKQHLAKNGIVHISSFEDVSPPFEELPNNRLLKVCPVPDPFKRETTNRRDNSRSLGGAFQNLATGQQNEQAHNSPVFPSVLGGKRAGEKEQLEKQGSLFQNSLHLSNP